MGGLHDAQRVPPWLFRNWTLIRQHDEKQVNSTGIVCFGCMFLARFSAFLDSFDDRAACFH
jgi:hypothetical protein